jgi:hypothetical protein
MFANSKEVDSTEAGSEGAQVMDHREYHKGIASAAAYGIR